MSHTVTVTRLPNEESDDVLYELGGDHDRCCISYVECQKEWHRHPNYPYEYGNDEWSTKRVPEVHHFIDGGWMVPDGGCGFHHAQADCGDFEPELTALVEEYGLGTYGVEVEWDGDWWHASPYVLAVQ